MTLIKQLVSTIEDEFHEYLDDTLINRLCKSLLCRQKLHQERQHDLSETADAEWRQLLKKASLCSLEDNPHQLTAVKMLSSLILSNPHCSHESLVLIRKMLHDNRCLPYLLEVLNYWLQVTHSISDLFLFKSLFDQDTTELLDKQLHLTQNVHLEKLILTVLAHLSLLGFPDVLLNDCTHCTNLGISFLYARTRLCVKYGVSQPPIEVTFNTWQRNFSKSLQLESANMLYLSCVNAIFVKDVPVGELAHFLTSLPSWTELYTRTMSAHLRHRLCVTGPVWDLILSSWSEAVTSSVNHGKWDSLRTLLKPLQSYARTRLPNPPQMSDCFLYSLLNGAILVIDQEDSSIQMCRSYLWYIFSVFITENYVNQAGPESLHVMERRIENLLTKMHPLITLDELKAILHACSEFCVLLSDRESVFRFVNRLICSVDRITDPRVSLTMLQAIIALIHRLETETHEHPVSCEDMLLLAFNIVTEQLITCLSDESQVDLDCNPDEFLPLMMNITKLILKQNKLSFSVDLNVRFVTSIRRLFEVSSDSTGFLFCHSELRVLLATALIHWMVFVTPDPSTAWATCDQLDQWTPWVQSKVNDLLDFDPTELLGSRSVMNVITQSQQKLNKIMRRDDSCSHAVSIISDLLGRLNAVLSCLNISDDTAEPSPLCPDCGEVTDQLIQDIIIARPGSMVTDCVEG